MIGGNQLVREYHIGDVHHFDDSNVIHSRLKQRRLIDQIVLQFVFLEQRKIRVLIVAYGARVHLIPVKGVSLQMDLDMGINVIDIL